MPAKESSLDQEIYKRLRRSYLLALGTIAFLVVVGGIFFYKQLNDIESDSSILGTVARQRTLSKEIANKALLLFVVDGEQDRLRLKTDLEATLMLWNTSQLALQHASDSLGISATKNNAVESIFEKTNPSFHNMLAASDTIINRLEKNPLLAVEELSGPISSINQNETIFSRGMSRVIDQYERQIHEKLGELAYTKFIFLCLILLLLLAEFIFVFRPTAKRMKNTIWSLLEAERKLKKMAHDADELSRAKERSVTELRALNRAMTQTLLFARISVDGDIIQMGEKFPRLFKSRKVADHMKFYDLLSIHENEKIEMERLLAENARKGWQGEVKATATDGLPIWLEMSLVPFKTGNGKWEILVIASDITARKQAQLEIERLNEQRFEEKINQQKLISSKIIENQENEQNRIAKDIHDGIGQMLTGLNFNLESIDMAQTEKAAKKIENLKDLTGKIIKGVRTATFNLMPPELSDHGIVPALTKLCSELEKLTGQNILLYNKTGFNERLDSLAEINIYRITQEGINNAIKYANSTHIIISVSHSSTILSISIDDNGKGFDPREISAVENREGGMGMTFMKERVQYINGRLFINSKPGKGTRITFNVPLD